jgi:hypothetical protein
MSIEQMTRDPKVWEVARSYAIAMGEVPNSFGTTVRTLISDHLKDPNNYSRGSVFLAGRLLKSQSVSPFLCYEDFLSRPCRQERQPYAG